MKQILAALAVSMFVACGGTTTPQEYDAGPTPTPVIATFEASVVNLPSTGGPTVLSWTVTGATSVELTADAASGLPAQTGLPATGTQDVTLGSTVTFTLSATNAGGTVSQSLTVVVATATDYGAEFVGTWESPWYVCSTTPCGGTTGVTPVQLGNWTAVITEPSFNSIYMDSTFTDNEATTVTCTNGLTITAGPPDPSDTTTYNGYGVMAHLTWAGTYSCVATGVASCNGADLNVAFTGFLGDLFTDGEMLLEYAVTQSCAGQSENVFYIIEPLVKQ